MCHTKVFHSKSEGLMSYRIDTQLIEGWRGLQKHLSLPAQ